jgi:hypothetical protein
MKERGESPSPDGHANEANEFSVENLQGLLGD